jgi:hypothetical protein
VHATARHRSHLRAALAAAVALALGASACAGSEAGPDRQRATFSRASGSSLAFEKPVATVSDLLEPAGDGKPWTIVGSMYDPDAGGSVAAVWTGKGARDWRRHAIRPARRGVSESIAAAVTVKGGALAVGRVGDGASSDGAVWRQSGDDWQQIRPPAMGGDHEQWAFDVTAGDGGILVAGGENVWGEVRPRLWFSSDGGDTWSDVDGGPGGPFDATGDESVRDIAAVGTGFVAVGSRKLDNEQDGVAWYSADGTSWEQLDAPTLTGPGRQELLAVVATGGTGLVAGGYGDDGSGGTAVPLSWRSPDGRTWEPASAALPLNDDPRSAATDLAVRSLSISDQGILASGGSEWRPHFWRSTDGVNWATLPNPVHGGLFEDGVQLVDAITAFGTTVAIGEEPTVLVLDSRWEDATGNAFPKGGHQPFAAAVAEEGDVSVAGGGIYTAPSGENREKYTGAVWRRSGGGAWTPVESDQLAPGQIMDVVPYDGGFAAVGIEDFGLASTRKIVGDDLPDGIAWVSKDGKDWSRIGATDARVDTAWLEFLQDPQASDSDVIAGMELEAPKESVEPAGGSGTRSLSAAAPLGTGFIAVGAAYQNRDADPIVVVSPDGNALTGENSGIGGPGVQRFNDVCVAPDGTAVAVGVWGTTGSFDVTMARRAPDGTWGQGVSTDGSFGGPGNQTASACAASKDGFVIVGSDDRSGDTDARVWTSKDGTNWTQLMASPLGGSGDQWASAVAAVPGGGWLVGGTDTAGGDGDIALWRLDRKGEVERRDTGERALGGPGEQSVTSVAVDKRGHVTLAGDDYGRVGLWESNVLDR